MINSASTGALSLRDISVIYRAQRRGVSPVQAVQSVSLDLIPGRIMGLAGPNGAGKTSLLEACLGTLSISSGTIEWFGTSELHLRDRGRIGFCPDVPAFPYRQTGYETLRMFAALDSVSTEYAEIRIAEYARRFRLESALEQRVEVMSRGTLQQLAFIRGILPQRELLICDETFAPLDPVAQVMVREVLREESDRGAAVLISSHQLDQLGKLADTVAIMSHGRITQRLDAQTLASTSILVLDVGQMSSDSDELVASHFANSWRVGSRRFVPWSTPRPEIGDLRRTLPEGAQQIRIADFLAFSLESVLLSAIDG